MASRYVHSGNTDWFQDAGFGLFLHWGIYSVAGIVESWSMKQMASEDDPEIEGRPGKKARGWSVDDYEALAPDFRALKYDPRHWAETARSAGMQYAVLTTKHHDGFCLWDTKTKEFNSVQIGPCRDLVGPYVEAMREAGIKVGLYFSLIDWQDEDFCAMPASRRFSSPKYPHRFEPQAWNRFLERMFAQVRELLTNYGQIDLFFFDVPGWGGERWCAEELKMMMLDLQPGIICNDRLPGMGDYTTPEQQVPFEPLEGLWESCMTMNHQWSWSPDQSRYKSAVRLLRTLVDVRFKGGNLLLNVGPAADGLFPEPATERLKALAEWMGHSGESIHGVRRGLPPWHFYGPTTRKGNTLYCHVFDPPGDAVVLSGIADMPVSVRLLRTGEEIAFGSENKRIVMELPTEKCDPLDTVLAVDFERPPRRTLFCSTVFADAGEALW